MYVSKNTLFDSQVNLAQGEITSQYYDIRAFKTFLVGLKVSPFLKIKAFVEDIEGTLYKKNFARIKTIIK